MADYRECLSACRLARYRGMLTGLYARLNDGEQAEYDDAMRVGDATGTAAYNKMEDSYYRSSEYRNYEAKRDGRARERKRLHDLMKSEKLAGEEPMPPKTRSDLDNLLSFYRGAAQDVEVRNLGSIIHCKVQANKNLKEELRKIDGFSVSGFREPGLRQRIQFLADMDRKADVTSSYQEDHPGDTPEKMLGEIVEVTNRLKEIGTTLGCELDDNKVAEKYKNTLFDKSFVDGMFDKSFVQLSSSDSLAAHCGNMCCHTPALSNQTQAMLESNQSNENMYNMLTLVFFLLAMFLVSKVWRKMNKSHGKARKNGENVGTPLASFTQL